MRTLTWQMVATLGIVVVGLVAMYGVTDDEAARMQLLGYFDNLVPFVVGAASGGAIAGTTGFLKGRGLL